MKVTHYRDRKPNGQFAKESIRDGKKKMSLYKQIIWLVFITELMYLGCVYADKVKAEGLEASATPQTTENIEKDKIEIDVLKNIADCESGQRNKHGRAIKGTATHYAKNGQVLLNPNKNGSVDVGIMQINDDVWGRKATELGLNIMEEKDNIAMGEYIHEVRGTQDWYSSKSCWK